MRDEFNAKLNSEIRTVLDKMDDVCREAENKITTLTNNIKSVCESKTATTNAHVVQTRNETDRQRQEVTAASSSLPAGIKEHTQQMGVTIDNLSQEISKS